jgi:hypothetical protein
MHIVRRASLALGAALVAACSGRGEPLPAPTTATAPGTNTLVTWPVKTRQHVDLWLHGFALVQDDTALVPYFRRGYRDEVSAAKSRGNVLTQLDVNRDQLRDRFRTNATLTNGQFLALYFGSWEDLNTGIDLFLRANGNPQRGGNEQNAAIIATFAQVFATAADRDWLRLFTNGLRDENDKFYRSWWQEQQRGRHAAMMRLDTIWGRERLPRLQRFLNNTRQASGDLLLSLPLDGEGRAVIAGERANAIAVHYPDRPENALDAVYVFVHESVGSLAAAGIRDNTTPAEQRGGVTNRYQSAAAVQTGAMLLQRTSPELVEGYQRYYLRAANRPLAAGASTATEFNRVFPIPDAIRDAIGRQLDVVLGGI